MTERIGLVSARESSANLMLALLLGVYVFNFVDRQILAILAGPIQRELHLSDARMGLLGGLAFASVYATLAVPVARIADRRGPARVIAAALAIWSVATALCGLAGGFAQLFAARLGVGIGEAGGVAPAHALIAARFPAERRALALAIHSLGIPLGSAAGLLLGAAIAAAVDWRAAFVVAGLAGLAFVAPFAWLVRDAPSAPPAAPDEAEPTFAATLSMVLKRPAFGLLSLGAAAGSTIGYGIAFWLPSLLQRGFGLSLVDSSRFIAALLLTTGIAGMLLGGRIADRLAARERAYHAWVPGIAYLASAPLFAAAFVTRSPTLAFALLLLPTGLSYVWLGPVAAAIQGLVEPGERATASALFLLINNLIGLGLGPWLIGVVSTTLTPRFGADALRLALLGGLGCYLIAGGLMAFAGRALRGGRVRG